MRKNVEMLSEIQEDLCELQHADAADAAQSMHSDDHVTLSRPDVLSLE